MAIAARELAKTVKAGNPGYQLCPVIFDGRRVRLLHCCFDRRQQIPNSMIEFGEQKSHAVSVQIELRRLPSHLFLRLWPYGYAEESSLLTSVCGEVASKDVFMIGWPLNHLGMAQGTDYVVIPGNGPACSHARTRNPKLIIRHTHFLSLGSVQLRKFIGKWGAQSFTNLLPI
jgi:hypothetical protein